jgi:hypothetical protein
MTGQYHWVSELAPASIQKELSYGVGWLTAMGWQGNCYIRLKENLTDMTCCSLLGWRMLYGWRCDPRSHCAEQ